MKNPSFKRGLERVSQLEQQLWARDPLLNRHGEPVDELTEQILRQLYRDPESEHSLLELAGELFLDPRELLASLRQLCVLNVIEEPPGKVNKFRKTRQPWNWPLVENVERSLKSKTPQSKAA